MAERFLESYGLGHLLQDPRFATNEARVRHAAELDAAVSSAVGGRTLDENVEIIETNRLSAHPVHTIREIERHPHWKTRGLLVDVPALGGVEGTTRMHDVIPRLSETPGEIRSAGGGMGADNDAIFVHELGVGAGELGQLRERGIV